MSPNLCVCNNFQHISTLQRSKIFKKISRKFFFHKNREFKSVSTKNCFFFAAWFVTHHVHLIAPFSLTAPHHSILLRQELLADSWPSAHACMQVKYGRRSPHLAVCSQAATRPHRHTEDDADAGPPLPRQRRRLLAAAGRADCRCVRGGGSAHGTDGTSACSNSGPGAVAMALAPP